MKIPWQDWDVLILIGRMQDSFEINGRMWKENSKLVISFEMRIVAAIDELMLHQDKSGNNNTKTLLKSVKYNKKLMF